MNIEKLTTCEELVMKVVWEADEEMSLMEIMDRVNAKYKKDWKPQTVSTFLARIVRKEYLRSYRSGRQFYYTILIPLESYIGHITNEYVKFWNHGNADEFLCALVSERKLRTEEIQKINCFLKAGCVGSMK